MALAATIGATTAAGGLAGAAAYVCGCCDPLVWRREAKVLPSIPEDAEWCDIFCKALGSRPRKLRVSLKDDILLVGRRPGPADAQFFLSGAQVSAEDDKVTIVSRSGDTIILYVGSRDVADQWAGELGGASMLVERSATETDPAAAGAAIMEHQDRVKNARISELEARVNATLTAAVQRSRKIQELEVVVEQGKEREERIKELEILVDQTTAECNNRSERIKELEDIISTGSYAAIKDEVATGILSDAMRFADEMLANREEEMMIDGSSASKLRESVERVQAGDRVVDREVAELISNLVAALRWPLVLRKRLANAENTVTEQKAVHDATLQQLHDVQKNAAAGQADLKALHERKSTSQAAQKVAQAEAEKLKGLLTKAEQDADNAVQQQREALAATHLEELRMVQELCDNAQAQGQAAQAQAADLRGRLQETERATVAADARAVTAESRSKEAMAEASELRESLAAAEQSEVEASQLRARLEKVQAAYEQASTQQSELLDGVTVTRGGGGASNGLAAVTADLELEKARTAELERRLAAAVLADRVPAGTASATARPSQGRVPDSRAKSHGPGRVTKELNDRLSRAERALGGSPTTRATMG